MEREILFRGISKETKAMVYGAYFSLHHDDHRTHIHHFIIPANTPIPKEKPIGEIQIEVDPTTVGQYTGLCDKDGKKIFEGDILKCVALSNDHHQKGAIVISPVEVWEGNACLSITHTPIYPFCIDHTLTIIGNIHDTPDLKKEESE